MEPTLKDRATAEPGRPETGEPEPVRPEYAGEWLAWSADGLRIVAVAKTSNEAMAEAARAGEPNPILQVAPGRARRSGRGPAAPTGEPEVVPLAYAGKWLAWSDDGLRIMAVAGTSEAAYQAAIRAGVVEPISERAPGRCRR